MKLDSLRSESPLEQVRQLEVKTHGNARQKFEHCHFATEAVPNRTELEPDRARADNEKFFWCLGKTERFSAANDSLAIEFREGQFDRNTSGCNNDVLGLDLLGFTARRFYGHFSRRRDRAHSFQHHHLVCLHSLTDDAGERFHHSSFAL